MLGILRASRELVDRRITERRTDRAIDVALVRAPSALLDLVRPHPLAQRVVEANRRLGRVLLGYLRLELRELVLSLLPGSFVSPVDGRPTVNLTARDRVQTGIEADSKCAVALFDVASSATSLV